MRYFIDLKDDDAYKQSIARIIASARKNAGLSQRQLSKLSGITPSILSRSENGQYMLSASNWVTVCGSLKISPDSLKYGFIDGGIFGVSTESTSQILIPEEYTWEARIQVRCLLPIFRYLDTIDGVDFFTFCQNTLNIDPHYLVIAENRVNLHFLTKLLGAIQILKGHDHRSDDLFIMELASFYADQMKDPKMHGKLSELYSSCRNKEDLLKEYVESKNKHQSLYEYKFQPASKHGKVLLEVFPTKFMEKEFWKMDVIYQLYFYDQIEKSILGMGKYPIEDTRSYQLTTVKNLINNDADKSFGFEVSIA